jgi:hypothetical protein
MDDADAQYSGSKSRPSNQSASRRSFTTKIYLRYRVENESRRNE